MDTREILTSMPFANLLGIEVTAAADGHAEGEIELRHEHASVPDGDVAHGGVAYALADTVGGAAVISLADGVCPTVDMRIDYLAPATDDLSAVADVVRLGGSVGVASVDVHDAAGHHVATARGVYKTGGDREGTPWVDGRVPGEATGGDRPADG